MDREEELLDLTHQILVALESPELNMTQEEKDDMESINNSMSFFMEQGNFERAVQEGRELLNRLRQT